MSNEFRGITLPNGERWLLDIGFLLSGYDCIYGRGCRGSAHGNHADKPSVGCCFEGCALEDDAEVLWLHGKAAELSPGDWQQHPDNTGVKLRRLHQRTHRPWNAEGKFVWNPLRWDWSAFGPSTLNIRVNDYMGEQACVFLNREGGAHEPGCSLHQTALKRGEAPQDWKPYPCYVFPVWAEGTPEGTYTLTMWQGGEDDRCCDSWPEAFSASSTPVFQTLEREVRETVSRVSSCDDAVDIILNELRLVYDRRKTVTTTPVRISSKPVAVEA